MNPIIFSRRLYGWVGSLIYVTLTLAFTPSILRNVSKVPAEMFTILILIVGFTLYSTLGWRWCLRRLNPRLIYNYFILQLVWFYVMFFLENAFSRNGAGTGNLSVIPLLQICVLNWRWRRNYYVLMVLGMGIISLPFLAFISVIMGTLTAFLSSGAILLIGHLIVSEEQARDELAAKNAKLAEYAAQIEELATVNERNRLAREIHDNVAHYLTAVNMQIEAARAVMPTDAARAEQSLVKAQTLTKDGLSEIRRSVAALRAEPVDTRPLHEAITLLVEEGRADGLTVDFQIEGKIRACSAQVEMTLYRIAQESLTNIRKHAQATHTLLELCYPDESHVRLKVSDNGVGSSQAGNGFGLLGIKERVKLLGGTLDIQTAQGQGFSLQVEVPA